MGWRQNAGSMPFAVRIAVLMAGSGLPATHAMTHGWDCISCGSNSMLVSNFGTWRTDLNLSDPWWVKVTAESHAAIFLNNFWNRDYNGTGTDTKVAVARALKAENPKLKVFFYQPADRLGDTVYVQNALKAHPEWWLRDDYGNLIPFGAGGYQIDTSVVSAQDFFANLSVSLFHSHAEAAALLDGVFVDGTSFSGASRFGPNVSDARYEKLFAGKMAMLAKMQKLLTDLNGGEVIGNPLMEYGQIGPNPSTAGDQKGANWNTTLPYYSGAFDEMFGAFGTNENYGHWSNMTGDWDVVKMRYSFESIINASAAGKTIVIHAFPGPAGTLNDPGGMFPTRPIPPPSPPSTSSLQSSRGGAAAAVRVDGAAGTQNNFRVAAWSGPVPVPKEADQCRAASASRLVESLAPFLIVASERVFFGYGWFYNMEDGYIPCPEGIECGMPTQWFPEYSKPLGPPLGPATTDPTRTVWSRRFEHATVSVDLRDRTASKIAWDS